MYNQLRNLIANNSFPAVRQRCNRCINLCYFFGNTFKPSNTVILHRSN